MPRPTVKYKVLLRNTAMGTVYSSLWNWLTTPCDRASATQRRVWLALSFTVAVLYGLLTLKLAFAGKYVVQDDARQHVFWMYRWVDSALFTNDLIADYFQSVAPEGYKILYRGAIALGIDPFVFNKVLPPILGLVTTGYAYGVSLQLFPIPAAAFGSTLLLNQVLWANDDLPSATPRAFVYPLLIAFLYYLLGRSSQDSTGEVRHSKSGLGACLILIALQGVFYPQAVFLSAGLLVLQLIIWRNGRFALSRDRTDLLFVGAGLGVAIAILLPYALQTSVYDPVITLAEARELREFQPAGRSRFFDPNPWEFWIHGNRSGILPRTERLPFLLYAAVLLPVIRFFPDRFPLVRQLHPQARILVDLILVSLGWFFGAHLVLFRLHLPSRYTQHSVRIVLCLAAAIALVVLLDALFRWGTQARWQTVLAYAGTAMIALSLVLYPNYAYEFPGANYRQGSQPELYAFLSQQPKDIHVATLSAEGDMIPSLAQRSVLVAEEYGIPYHMGYYNEFRKRAIALAEAQYSPNLTDVQQFIQEYDIDLWLLDADAFSDEYLNQVWVRQYPEFARDVRRTTRQSEESPALERAIAACTVWKNQDLVLLDAACIE